jgi:hypothetical protein
MAVLGRPLPHPLDFDWRYAEDTAMQLASILESCAPVLCIGAPTVARLLEDRGTDVTLLDRQPFQNVGRHLALDVREFEPDRVYQVALVDPPWYPVFLRSWTRTAACAVGFGGTVLVSAWPEITRPRARAELDAVLTEIGEWGDVERDVAHLTYEIPLFENIARGLCEDPRSRSPGLGELVSIRVRSEVPRSAHHSYGTPWQRFVFDDYQLALKLRDSARTDLMEMVSGAKGWLWPYVSARAPGRENIDLWSSHGEVARTGAPLQIAGALRRAAISRSADEFDRALAPIPGLNNWHIPRPPYRRFAEWLHHQ